MEQIVKRTGEHVDFDSSRIQRAIQAANESVGQPMSSLAVAYAVELVCKQNLHTVEEIQDTIETVLLSQGFVDVAKSFIAYRSEHAKIRAGQQYLADMVHKFSFSLVKDNDAARENANIDGSASMGVMLKYGTTIANWYIDNYILPKDISAAHNNGYIHI